MSIKNFEDAISDLINSYKNIENQLKTQLYTLDSKEVWVLSRKSEEVFKRTLYSIKLNVSGINGNLKPHNSSCNWFFLMEAYDNYSNVPFFYMLEIDKYSDFFDTEKEALLALKETLAKNKEDCNTKLQKVIERLVIIDNRK